MEGLEQLHIIKAPEYQELLGGAGGGGVNSLKRKVLGGTWEMRRMYFFRLTVSPVEY